MISSFPVRFANSERGKNDDLDWEKDGEIVNIGYDRIESEKIYTELHTCICCYPTESHAFGCTSGYVNQSNTRSKVRVSRWDNFRTIIRKNTWTNLNICTGVGYQF